MTLSAGMTLGPYEILAMVGEGGMGEVYRAVDKRLNRTVAIKVSAEEFNERFEREARAVASLNHPNICQLYDVGPNYLVMEFIEGPTLDSLIANGVLKEQDALPIARQLAEAIEAAHDKGIIHRDLKPANIKLTPDGAVKVLDFGLAKAAETTDPSSAPTVKGGATLAGVIMGTPGYMSPEQARGLGVDKRTDIWAYGVILYEMLTGTRLFEGTTISDSLVAVLTREPVLERVPPRFQRLVERCLAKDPKRRLRDIGEARLMLEEGTSILSPASAVQAGTRSSRFSWPVATLLAVCAAAVFGGSWWRATRPVEQPLLRFLDEAEAGFTAIPLQTGSNVVISPDGMRLAIVAAPSGKEQLFTRKVDLLAYSAIAGTEGAMSPFFSPDGRWIGFFADGKLKKVSVEGGPVITLCDAPDPRGATWTENGYIIASLANPSPLSKIPASGGKPEVLTKMEGTEATHRYPHALPGGKGILFVSMERADADNADINVFDLQTGTRKKLHHGGTFPKFSRNGHLLFQSGGTIYAMPFDPSRLEAKGGATPVLESVSWLLTNGATQFDISHTGTVVYRRSSPPPLARLAWLDAEGTITPLPFKAQRIVGMRLSPDGNRVLLTVGAGADVDVWVYDIARSTPLRLTSGGGRHHNAIWSVDGRYAIYGAPDGIRWLKADGTGQPRLVIPNRGQQSPGSFSPDGSRLATTYSTRHVHIIPIAGSTDEPRAGTPEPFLTDSLSQGTPAFSPDGKWLAYYVRTEDRIHQIYVTAFPGKATRWQISKDTGGLPQWSPTTRELFFIDRDGRIMVASYTVQGDTFVAGKPHPWSKAATLPKPDLWSWEGYLGVAPDAKRCLILVKEEGQIEKPPTQLTVLLNFFDEIKRRVALGRTE